MDQAAMDKMFAQLAKSARIDVFKTSLDSMQEALEVSRRSVKMRRRPQLETTRHSRRCSRDLPLALNGSCLYPQRDC